MRLHFLTYCSLLTCNLINNEHPQFSVFNIDENGSWKFMSHCHLEVLVTSIKKCTGTINPKTKSSQGMKRGKNELK